MSETEFNIGKAVDQAALRSKLDRQFVVGKLEKAVLAEAQKFFRGRELEVQLDSFNGYLNIFQSLEVVHQALKPLNQVPLADVQKGDFSAEIGDELLFRLFYRSADTKRAQEQMDQFSRTPALRFEFTDFEEIAISTAKAILNKIRSSAAPPSIPPTSTGLGRRIRRGAIFVDSSRANRKIPLPKEIDILNRAAKTYKAGATVCREGEQSGALLLMMSGQIDVYQGDRMVNTIDGEIKFIGLLSYFTKGLRTATLKAHKDSRVVQIPEGSIAPLFGQAPSLALRMLQDLSDLFVRREGELRKLQNKTQSCQPHLKLMDDLSQLALTCVTDSDAEIRSFLFARVHKQLLGIGLVKEKLQFGRDFPGPEIRDESTRNIFEKLKHNAVKNQASAQLKTDARAKLLMQMDFGF
jgi:CRP-like cAMP-binding protein